MRGLAILLGFNLLGVLLHEAKVPLPGNVIGLVLFAACLFLGVVKVEWVEDAAGFLLRHMLLFFAPAIVAAVPRVADLRPQWAAVAAGLVGSLLVVLLVTGWVASGLIREDRGRTGRGGASEGGPAEGGAA